MGIFKKRSKTVISLVLSVMMITASFVYSLPSTAAKGEYEVTSASEFYDAMTDPDCKSIRVIKDVTLFGNEIYKNITVAEGARLIVGEKGITVPEGKRSTVTVEDGSIINDSDVALSEINLIIRQGVFENLGSFAASGTINVSEGSSIINRSGAVFEVNGQYASLTIDGVFDNYGIAVLTAGVGVVVNEGAQYRNYGKTVVNCRVDIKGDFINGSEAGGEDVSGAEIVNYGNITGEVKSGYLMGGFDDVTSEDWFYKYVSYCTVNNYMSGVGDNKFSPDTGLTRAMFVTIMSAVESYFSEMYGYDPAFTDVKSGSWYSAPVNWASRIGMTSGKSESSFAPNDLVTRQEIAVMLYKYAKSSGYDTSAAADLTAFPDNDKIASWANEAMAWAVASGMISGNADGTLDPAGTATRAQAATMIRGFVKNIAEAYEIEAVEILGERQLFTDDYIINTICSDSSKTLNKPVKEEVVFTFDTDYESDDAVYFNTVKMDDGTYRMYYKATGGGKRRICYIESTDGLTWTRPELTINTMNGRYTTTNIVTSESISPDNLFVFRDKNPASDGNPLKGIYGQWADGLFLELPDENGAMPFGSYQRLLMDRESTEGCYFDTLNTMTYDTLRGKYVAFVRGFHKDGDYDLEKEEVDTALRDIRYTESEDLVNWSTPVPLDYGDDDTTQMYANA
ncbi:MAG: S-layer homology domain-containing protein, partial [Clostridia bacterium]|nr:S-layer homology domain-containing protein [Clostridia bacterium]